VLYFYSISLDKTCDGENASTENVRREYYARPEYRSWKYRKAIRAIAHRLWPSEGSNINRCETGNSIASIWTSYLFIKLAAAQDYFRFRVCWYRCLQKFKVYEQTKFCRHISIDGWDITTSVFEKQTSAILEIYFRFRFWLFARNMHIILHQATEFFFKIEATTAEIWRHIHFSRWRPRRLNTTSGFVSVDVTAFRRLKSNSKPNFVEISQMEAEIYFYGNPKWLGKGSNFFSKSRMCQYPGMFCYILWIQKCIFDACRLSLHNSTPSHCTRCLNKALSYHKADNKSIIYLIVWL